MSKQTIGEAPTRGLEDLVRSGKILYPGLSNFPAWRTAGAVTIAEFRGWTPVSAVQLEYSLVERSAERDLLPMAAAFDLGVFGWSPLGGGLLTGKYRKGETGRAEGLGAVIHAESDARKTAVLDVLLAMAEEIGRSPGQIALAWALAKGVTPILGPRTLEQVRDNLAGADLVLSSEQMALLDAASALPLGQPYQLLADPANLDRLAGGRAEAIDLPGRTVR